MRKLKTEGSELFSILYVFCVCVVYCVCERTYPYGGERLVLDVSSSLSTLFLRQTLTERSSLFRLGCFSSKPWGSTCLGLGWDSRHTACTRFYISFGDPDAAL